MVPAERMKGGKEHTVPLSDRAVEILEALPRSGSDFVFESGRAGHPISNMAMTMTLRRMGRGDLTVHGFRSTFRDWAAEQTQPRTTWSRWRWRTRSATRSRRPTAAASCSQSAAS